MAKKSRSSEAIEEFKSGIDSGKFGVLCSEHNDCLNRPVVINAVAEHLLKVLPTDGEIETMMNCIEDEGTIERIFIAAKKAAPKMPNKSTSVAAAIRFSRAFEQKFGRPLKGS